MELGILNRIMCQDLGIIAVWLAENCLLATDR